MELTKKVVVNRCYGGFGISALAEQEILKRKGKEAFYYAQTKHSYRDGVDEYTKMSSKDMDAGRLHMYSTFTKDYGPSFASITDEMFENYFYCRDLERDDPDLIAVVEELGEASWGQFAKLEVVEIPADVDFEIEEYDGREWVSEVHRTW